MSESTTLAAPGDRRGTAVAEPAEARVYSKDYWDIVFEQLARRKLFKIGLAVLALLYAVAIYAPLIANDKPYSIEAIDYGEYRNAARSISAVGSSLARKLGQTEAEYSEQLAALDAERRAVAPQTLAADVAGERAAAEQRLDTLRRYLPPEEHAPLDAFEARIAEAVELHAAGDAAGAAALAEELRAQARDFRREFQAAEPGAETEGGKELVPHRSYPLLESISPWEVYFMVLWALVLAWPLWNRAVNAGLLGGDRGRIRRWRRLKLAAALGLPACAAGLWAAAVDGGGSPFSVSPWKGALSSGDVVATSEPIWPPLRYGYAETHPAENFRAPTWIADSELDWSGYYVRGARVPLPQDFPPTTPADVRARVEAAADGLRDPAAGEAAWAAARAELVALARPSDGSSTVGDVRPHLIAELWRLRNAEGPEAAGAVERLSGALAEVAGVSPEPDPELVAERGAFALAQWWPRWAYEHDALPGGLRPGVPVEVRVGEPGANSPLRRLAGTDELGRDFLVRMVWGGRVSLSVGIVSALLLTGIGVVVGALAGYFGGWVDVAIMRLIEVLQAIPPLFLMLIVLAFTDPNVVPPLFAIVVVIALIRWTSAARLVRGEFLRLREQEFVVAAQALGFSNRRTIFKHVLPNAMSPVFVNAAFAVASGILFESVISFLGFGVQHPEASWGSLVNESRSPDHWWIQVFPGLLIFVTVTCYNLVGDAIRDALDPKLRMA